jgi:isoleucyl-tRNA synthetase
MAPIAPFFSDYVYHQLLGETGDGLAESIHLTTFPAVDISVIDTALENDMAFVKKVVSLALAARKRKNLKVRQPLSRIVIHAQDEKPPSDDTCEIILRELNIKNIEFAESPDDFVSYTVKLDFAKLGPKFGKAMGEISKAAQALSQDEIKQFMIEERLNIEVGDRQVDLSKEDVEIVRHEQDGFGVEVDGPVMIALDTALTPELIDEGFARELVNKIQNMRKSSGFEVTDRIRIKLFADEPLAGAADRFEQYICDETLADSLEKAELNRSDGDDAAEWKINGEKAVISVARL